MWDYAKAADAVFNHLQGWLARGRKTTGKIHPRAQVEFTFRFGDAEVLASGAYGSDPGLLPAADMLILLGNPTGNKFAAFQVLHEVMQLEPNWPSLQNALWMTDPAWGGESGMVEMLCDYYAPKIDFPYADMVQYCRLWGLYTYHVSERRAEVYRMLDPVSRLDFEMLPELRDLEASRMIRTDRPDRAGLDFGRWYFDTFPVTDIDLAETFDRYYIAQFGGEPVSKAVLDRAKAHARGVGKRPLQALPACASVARRAHRQHRRPCQRQGAAKGRDAGLRPSPPHGATL